MFNATYCSSYVYLEVKIIAGIDFPVQSNMITYSVWIYGTTHNPCLCMWSFMSSCELNKTYQYIFDSQLIENLTNQIETNGQNQSNPVTSIGNSSLHGQNFGFDQNHSSTSIQQALAHTLTQAQGSHVQSTSQVSSQVHFNN